MASKPSPSATVSGPPSKRRQAACGTDSGYNAHLRRGEDPCVPCKKAHAAKARARNATKRAAKKQAAGGTKRSGRGRDPDPAANAAFIAALAAEVDRDLPVVPDVITDEWWAAWCARRAQERPGRLSPPRAPHPEPCATPGSTAPAGAA